MRRFYIIIPDLTRNLYKLIWIPTLAGITVVVACYLVLFIIPVQAETSEEETLNELAEDTSLEQAAPEVVDKNVFQNILDFLGNIAGGLFFFAQPTKPEKAFARSEFLQQGNVPPELKSAEGDAKEQLKDNLGGNAGFYGLTTPKEISQEGVGDSECLYEQSRFPEGVNPVTGGSGCK